MCAQVAEVGMWLSLREVEVSVGVCRLTLAFLVEPGQVHQAFAEIAETIRVAHDLYVDLEAVDEIGDDPDSALRIGRVMEADHCLSLPWLDACGADPAAGRPGADRPAPPR